jgi:hypothetical protein
MSYSFTVDAENKTDLAAQVHEGLTKIEAAAPDHKDSCAQAAVIADALIPSLSDAADRLFRASVSVMGSVSQEGQGADAICVGAHINVNVGVMSYPKPKVS